MDNEDILRNTSPEIKEIFTLGDQTAENMEQSIKTNKPSLNGERYLNNKQVCDILLISPRCLQDYRDKGRIAFYKLEGKILFAESDVYKLLEDNYNQSWKQE